MALFFWAALAMATAWSRSAGLADISSPTTLPVVVCSTGLVGICVEDRRGFSRELPHEGLRDSSSAWGPETVSLPEPSLGESPSSAERNRRAPPRRRPPRPDAVGNDRLHDPGHEPPAITSRARTTTVALAPPKKIGSDDGDDDRDDGLTAEPGSSAPAPGPKDPEIRLHAPLAPLSCYQGSDGRNQRCRNGQSDRSTPVRSAGQI